MSHMPSQLSRTLAGGVQAGAFACIFSLFALISFVVSPGTTIYIVFLMPVGRLYSNVSFPVMNKINIESRLGCSWYIARERQPPSDH